MSLRSWVTLGLLFISVSAFGQSRVFTNADLGKPLHASSRLDPAAAAAIVAPHQFVYVDTRSHWTFPQIVVIPSSPSAGPFGAFAPFDPPRRLDGSLQSDSPWHVTTYVGRSYGHPLSGAAVGVPAGTSRPTRPASGPSRRSR